MNFESWSGGQFASARGGQFGSAKGGHIKSAVGGQVDRRLHLSPLLNRNDEKYTQIVRNLKSHKTFIKKGLAEDIDGGFRITPAGAAWLEDNGFIEAE